MTIDARSIAYNVLPRALLNTSIVKLPLEGRDLTRLSGGHDFLLQASNRMCAEVAFKSLQMPWAVAQLDATAIAALLATGATFKSSALHAAITARVGVGSANEILLLFSAKDVQFDATDQCRIRLNVRVALGSSLALPK